MPLPRSVARFNRLNRFAKIVLVGKASCSRRRDHVVGHWGCPLRLPRGASGSVALAALITSSPVGEIPKVDSTGGISRLS